MTWVDPRIEDMRERGAEIGDGVYLGDEVYIEKDFAGLLTIESGVVVSRGVSILLHDSSLNNVLGEQLKFAPVVLRQNSYIGANCTIMCGVEIGERALVGACSLVTGDIPPATVAFGVPARVTGSIEEAAGRQRERRDEQRPGHFYVDALPWRERTPEYYEALNQSIAAEIDAVASGR